MTNKEEEYKKCTDCNGSGIKVLITKIGLAVVPITLTCPICDGEGKIKNN